MVKFARTGGEAAAIAIKIAGRITKKYYFSLWLSWMA